MRARSYEASWILIKGASPSSCPGTVRRPAARPQRTWRLGVGGPPALSSVFRPLSSFDFEVLRWIAEGKRDGEIAVIFGIGVRTVNTHVSHILVKLGAETRTAAVRAAREPASKDRAA